MPEKKNGKEYRRVLHGGIFVVYFAYGISAKNICGSMVSKG